MAQDEIARTGWAVTPAQALALVGKPDVALIDLRERSERERHGVIPGSLHAPYPDLQENIRPGGMLHELRDSPRQAHGLLLRLRRALGHGGAGGAQDAGIASACHIHGGIQAWKEAQGPLLS